jgi:dipeptidyl aminopeptidase/acylaminoacyl peptidase
MRILLPLLSLAVFASCRNQTTPPDFQEYTIEQFFQTEAVGGVSFSTDESKILIHSNRSGIFNLYQIQLADSSRQALTASANESLFAIGYVPGTDYFLFSADKGGNENNHLYLQTNPITVRDLTPGVKEKASFLNWTEDKKHFYYLSNKRNPLFFDLYKMDTVSWEPVLMYKNDSGFDINLVSHNERYYILTRNITTDRNELYLYDKQTGETRKLSATGTEDATYYPAAFEPDDNYLYYITNEGSEFSYVVKYNINTAARETFFSTNWDVVGMTVSENHKYHVLYINEDGRDRVQLFEHSTGKEVKLPRLKNGYISGITIAPSEKNLILTVSSDRSSDNLYWYNLETKQLKQLTNTFSPEINTAHLVDAQVVRFKSFDGLEIPAILYKPHQASPQNKVPALVWVHGGPGGQSRAGYSNTIQYFVNHGYAVLAVNNRGSSGYGKTFYKMDNRNHGDKDLKDCLWGRNWLAKQPYIDSTKIGIYGGSYGGFMALAGIIQYPEAFAVGVNLFGVTNWLRTLRSIPPYWESFRKALYDEMGDPGTADSVRLKAISPLFHAHQIKTPLLVLQGSNDPRVLQVESDEIVAGAKANGVPVEYILFPDEGHGFVKKENQMKAARETLRFLNTYLKK